MPAKILGKANPEDKKGKEDIVIPILQDLEVLAIANRPANEHEENLMLLAAGQANKIKKYSTITINVTPKEAAILATAQDKGDLIALLRNRNDKSGATFSSVNIEDILTHVEKMVQENKLRKRQNSLT